MQELVASLVPKVCKALKVKKEDKARLVHKASKVTAAQLVYLVSPEMMEYQDVLVSLVHLVHQVGTAAMVLMV